MKTFKAALIQQKSVLGNKEWNFQQIKRLLKEIDISDIELVLLPELNLTGHGGHKDMVSQAETIPVSYTHLDVYKRQVTVHLPLS